MAVRGPNGTGKTSLLEVALGLRRPLSGRSHCDLLRVGYIAQNAKNWCLEESLAERMATLESPAPTASPLALADRPLATLSPGERLRAALVCLTRRDPPPEMLVLDEPTQHLDFDGLASLEALLAAWPGGLMVVSHDAELLAAVGISTQLDLAVIRMEWRAARIREKDRCVTDCRRSPFANRMDNQWSRTSRDMTIALAVSGEYAERSIHPTGPGSRDVSEGSDE